VGKQVTQASLIRYSREVPRSSDSTNRTAASCRRCSDTVDWPTGTAATIPYGPEKAINYEIGAKGTIDNRFRYSAAIYDIEWHNLQEGAQLTPLVLPAGINMGDAYSRGFETELYLKVTEHFSGQLDYTYDHTKDSTDPNNLQSSLVGMFFHVNWLHDRWYEAGFDEASGNAQTNNFGLGGLGGDPILAEGADFSGTDNANSPP